MKIELYKNLESRELFFSLLQKFIDRSIQEMKTSEQGSQKGISYSLFYERIINKVAISNADIVFSHSQSPIEKIFLNSLILLFIKNGFPCLFFTPPLKNAELELKAYRDHYTQIENFISSYKEVTKDYELINFEKRLKEKAANGEFTEEEIDDILSYQYFGRIFERNSYRITPQAAFPYLKVAGKSIRVDMLIWVPGDESVKIVVECDGYQFHNTKEAFYNDRIRDRLLQQHGYRVIRYSGKEINQNPAEVSSNLFDLLMALDKDENNLRII